jgi:hypothetical protein
MQTAKERALVELRREFDQAVYPCLVATSGVPLLVIPGSGIPIAATLLAIAGPRCTEAVQRLADLQKTYDDPPDFDYDTIAPIAPTARPSIELPSCSEATGTERGLCRRLIKAAKQYVAKAQRVGDVVTALRTTIERASAALLAGDDRALKKQLRAAGKRQRQLDAALAARARTGGKLASVLGEAQVTGSMTQQQYVDAAFIVLGKLEEQGLPQAEVQEALGSALRPKVIDVLELLAR